MKSNLPLHWQLSSKLNPMASVFVSSAQVIQDDNSHVHTYSSLSSSDKPSHNVGVIGDRRCSITGPSSTSSDAGRYDAACHASRIRSRASLLHDLLEGSTPDSDCHRILKPFQQTNVSRVPWAASLNHTPTKPMLGSYSTNVRNERTKAHATSNDSISSADGTLASLPASFWLNLSSQLQQSVTEMTHARHDSRINSEPTEQLSASPGTIPIFDTRSISTRSSISSLDNDTSSEKSEHLLTPIWHRAGPSFATLVKHSAKRYKAPQYNMKSFGSSPHITALDDVLDPEEFTLPYGVSLQRHARLRKC